ncbi:hypothetical protein B7463_g11527, partial [Scytalidium lignicola]
MMDYHITSKLQPTNPAGDISSFTLPPLFTSRLLLLHLLPSRPRVQLNDFHLSSSSSPHRRLVSSWLPSVVSEDTLIGSLPSSRSSNSGETELEYGNELNVIHAVLIPNYKEDINGLRETLDVLACHPQAPYQYDIYLAMESREVDSDIKARVLVSEFTYRFRSIKFTLHPGDIPGEALGKSSNVAWASRKASERYLLKTREEVIVTIIDGLI